MSTISNCLEENNVYSICSVASTFCTTPWTKLEYSSKKNDDKIEEHSLRLYLM